MLDYSLYVSKFVNHALRLVLFLYYLRSNENILISVTPFLLIIQKIFSLTQQKTAFPNHFRKYLYYRHISSEEFIIIFRLYVYIYFAFLCIL